MNGSKQQTVAAWIGVDWADEAHAVCEYNVGKETKLKYELTHGAEPLQQWLNGLREHYAGQGVAVILEQSRGGLIHALMTTEFVSIYPVNPQSLAQFRKAMYPSGAKHDPPDAELLSDMVRQNPHRFRAWKPGDEQSRGLRLLTEARRKFVDDMTALTNQLTSALKDYYPQALSWIGDLAGEQACEFLERWPSLMELQKTRSFRVRDFFRQHGRPNPEALKQKLLEMQKATPLTTDGPVIQAGVLKVQALVAQIRALRPMIEKYDREIERLFQQHPDRPIFESFPGAGRVLAPRLTAAFGADRDRYHSALEIQELSGIAPVTERSGKKQWVHRRWACPRFVLQTFHEFADQARKFSAWSKAFYQQQRDRGNDHHAAVRALAYKWIRIMYRCWKDRLLYDDAVYTRSLAKRGSTLLKTVEI